MLKEIGSRPSRPSFIKVPKLLEKPNKESEKYIVNIKWYHKLFGLTNQVINKIEKIYENDLELYNSSHSEKQKIENINKYKLKEYNDLLDEYNKEIESDMNYYNKLFEDYSNLDDNLKIKAYFEKVIKNFSLCFSIIEFKHLNLEYNFEDRSLVVDFLLPQESYFPKAKAYKYVKSRNEINEIQFKEKERNELIKDTYYSMYLAIAYEIYNFDISNKVSDIILNGFYKGIDKRTGKEFEVCIMSSKIPYEEFKDIDFKNINPRDTFKYFKGRGTPDVNNITQIEPIRFSDKSKFKIINSDSVLDSLSAESNLAAMDWQDFEVIIRDVFELEFREQDIEIKNTQQSNDGGIDVVAFNKNPYTGGVILLQAKRYTNIVTPEPVRALKGSMDEHKAIRGILVTTSDFGNSSREFANAHNITLINGDQLVDLFSSHGFNFHINLEQAKILNCK